MVTKIQIIKEAIKEERKERWGKILIILKCILIGMIIISLIIFPFLITYEVGKDKGYNNGWIKGNNEAWDSAVNQINNLSCGENFTILADSGLVTKTLYTEKCRTGMFYENEYTLNLTTYNYMLELRDEVTDE